MRRYDLQIANFITTFGAKGELLDYAEEIIIPSFFDDSQVRKHGSSTYYIYEPKWIDLGSDGRRELAIFGRFVKDTTLTREQVYRRGKLLEDHQKMQSSPSAFFVLLLRDHRLLYFAETANAPEIKTFASTVQIYFRRKWRLHLKEAHGAQSNTLTHKELRKKIPMPTLNIVPVAKTGSVKSLLAEFDKITRLRFRLIRPNQETDASKVFQSVRERLQPLDPSRLDIDIAQGEGLDKDETVEAVAEAAKGMNTDIILRGTDLDGNRLKIENDDLALRVPIKNPPKAKKSLAKRLYKTFLGQVSDGTVKRVVAGQRVKDTIEYLSGLVL